MDEMILRRQRTGSQRRSQTLSSGTPPKYSRRSPSLKVERPSQICADDPIWLSCLALTKILLQEEDLETRNMAYSKDLLLDFDRIRLAF